MRIDHVGVWVEDLDRVRDFYVAYLGAVDGPRYTNPAKGFESCVLTLTCPAGAADRN